MCREVAEPTNTSMTLLRPLCLSSPPAGAGVPHVQTTSSLLSFICRCHFTVPDVPCAPVTHTHLQVGPGLPPSSFKFRPTVPRKLVHTPTSRLTVSLTGRHSTLGSVQPRSGPTRKLWSKFSYLYQETRDSEDEVCRPDEPC